MTFFTDITDPLFRYQTYLSGYDYGFGSHVITEDTPVLNIAPIWEQYRGEGIHVGIGLGIVDNTHPDLTANYNAGALALIDPLPLIADYEAGATQATFVAGVIAADDDGQGLVGVAPDATVSYLGSTITDQDIMVLLPQQDRDTTLWDAYDPATLAATGRGGKGIITIASAPAAAPVGAWQEEGYWRDHTVTEYADHNNRAVITVSGMTATGGKFWGEASGDMILVGAPIFSDIAQGADSLFNHTLGLDLSGDLGVNGSDDSLGMWTFGAGLDQVDPSLYQVNTDNALAASGVTAGVVALMLDANPNLGWRDVQQILAYSALQPATAPTGTEQVTANGATTKNGGGLLYSGVHGFGQIDPFGAVRLAQSWGGGQRNSANELTVIVDADPAVIGSTVDVNGVWEPDQPQFADIALTATQAVNIEHVSVTLRATVSPLHWLDVTADQMIVQLISPSGAVSNLTGTIGEAHSATGDTIDMTFTSRRFWGESATAGDGVWTLRFVGAMWDTAGVTIEDLALQFHGNGEYPYTTYYFNDDALRSAEFGIDPLIEDTDGFNVVNTVAIARDVVLNAAAGSSSFADGVEIFRLGADTTMYRFTTGDGDDLLIGNAATRSYLQSGRGDDILIGGTADDLMYGERGDDTFDGGGGRDVINGGTGFDTAIYNHDYLHVYTDRYGATIVRDPNDLTTGDDRLSSIERIVFNDGIWHKGRLFSDTSLRQAADTDDLYSWASLDEVVGTDGNVRHSYTVFDNGRIDDRHFYDGIYSGLVASFEMQDAGNAYAWTAHAARFDSLGRQTWGQTTFDEGRTLTLTFSGGVLTQRTHIEFNGAFNKRPWNAIYEYFDATTGERTQTVTRYDDGRNLDERFDPATGLIVSRLETDPINTAAWTEKEDLFDAQGHQTSSRTDYDDGRVTTGTFVDGVLVQQTTSDPDNAHGWTSVTELFDAVFGRVTQRTTLNDNGLEVVGSFDAETGTATGLLQRDTGNAYNWTERQHLFDEEGRPQSATVLQDDGRVSTATYVEGSLDVLTVTDPGERFAWSEITRDFDVPTGVLQTLTTVYDNGHVVAHTHDVTTGVRTQTRQWDNDDVFIWTEMTQDFDPVTGAAVATLVQFDDGRTDQTDFVDGVISTRLITDTENRFAWTTSFETYDETGTLTERVITYDNGTERTTTFDDALL